MKPTGLAIIGTGGIAEAHIFAYQKEPERALMAFLQSTYDAAADLGKWDRAALECGLGERRKVRVV